MNKSLFSLLVSLVIVGAVAVGDVLSQGSASGLEVTVELNKAKYRFNDPADLIEITLNINNVSDPAQPIIVPQGFSKEPFESFLLFTDPDGQRISASAKDSPSEPPPPPVIPVGNKLVQVEAVEVLGNDFRLTIRIPNARKIYSLTKPGNYSVKARVVIRTYPAVDHVVSGVEYAELSSVKFAGALKSNTVKFSVVAGSEQAEEKSKK